MAIFGKMSIFRPFELFVFYSLEKRFLVLKYRKRHFIAQKGVLSL